MGLCQSGTNGGLIKKEGGSAVKILPSEVKNNNEPSRQENTTGGLGGTVERLSETSKGAI